MFIIPDYNSPSHQLKLESAFGVIANITLSYPVRGGVAMPVAENKVNVNANVAIYSSKNAYETNAEALHYRPVNVSNSTDNLGEIKTLIIEELSK